MSDTIKIIIPEDVREGSEARFGSWMKQPGDAIEQDEPIAEIHTDKATVEISAPASGTLHSVAVNADDPVESGMVIGHISPGENLKSTPATESVIQTPPSASKPPPSKTVAAGKISPAVKRLIEKHNLDISGIKGSGRGGRITRSDIESLIGAGTSSPGAAAPGYTPQPIVATGKKVPHSHLRRQIAAHMQYSVQTAPHVTSVFECDLSAVIKHRAANKAAFEARGSQLTYSSYFVAATVAAIQEVPESNSCWHDEHVEIFSDANIGVGTSLGEDGIVVPVLHSAEALSFEDIAAGLTTLITRARESTLSPEEMSNGTFTISNHGVSGSLVASPIIIHQPQSAILGIGRLQKRAIVSEERGKETVTIKPMMYVTLTIDHRVLDAHQTNRFLTRFVDVLENWKQ